MPPLLAITNLRVKTENTEILHGVNLTVDSGQVVALMGPNGSGKSTLANTLLGHPSYEITQGKITYNNQDITELKPEERAQAGLFLSFQYPQEIAGVTIGNFLRLAYNATRPSPKASAGKRPLSVPEFIKLLKAKMDLLHMPHDFMTRSVNEGFSGGEKKRAEMLQLAVLEPKLAILDETDSGLDIDSLKIVAEAVNTIKQEHSAMAILIITHYQRILNHLPANRIAVMRAGTIIKEGDQTLLATIERDGYKTL